MRKARYDDLIEKYENPIEHPCDVEEGAVYYSVDAQKPNGFCESAWESVSPFVKELSNGGGNFYDGWMKNPQSAMISCNDGFRPVSFYIEACEQVIIMLKFICYPKCTTCQKAKKWLDDNVVLYELRDIKLDKPSLEELRDWYNKSGLPLKKFFNTSGLLYKSLELKSKLPDMSEEDMLKLLATDGMLVKRPLLIGDDFVLVGFKEIEWKAKL